MHPFAEGFGQAVGQQLREDGVVVVALRAELFGQLLEPYAAREGEGPDIVGSACLFVGDEIGQTAGLGFPDRGLAAQHRQDVFLVFRAGDHDVVAPADGCEDARYALEGEEFFFADAGQHLLRVVVELAGFGAVFGVFEDLRYAALEPPRREEEVPVDQRLHIGDTYVRKHQPSRMGRNSDFGRGFRHAQLAHLTEG